MGEQNHENSGTLREPYQHEQNHHDYKLVEEHQFTGVAIEVLECPCGHVSVGWKRTA